MSKLKSNIDELRKIIAEDNFKIDEATEFLDAIESEMNELKEELSDCESELKSSQEEVSDLETKLEEAENQEMTSVIECGIGTIEFNEPDNLVLQDIMENLEGAIKKSTPNNVSTVLAALN